MKTLIVAFAAAALVACGGQPTQAELDERQRELNEYCNDLRDEIEDKRTNRPLLAATAQDRYNRECLGVQYPGN